VCTMQQVHLAFEASQLSSNPSVPKAQTPCTGKTGLSMSAKNSFIEG
jgi:hypothetical protein